MIELMIDTWINPREGTTYRWSLWADGARVANGGPHASAAESEAEGLKLCVAHAGRQPDRITRL
jgi:hypothetical protein